MTPRHRVSYKQTGATLVELIITIVIISAAMIGIFGVINLTTRHSADPLVQQQAIAIAESYLEEILLLPITDPDGANSGESRSTFDNIDDYDNLSNAGVIDQNGNAISQLNNYTVAVSVSDHTIDGVTFKQVNVSVSRANTTVSLTGYRADY
jgi:MSHA pilin protein MshD